MLQLKACHLSQSIRKKSIVRDVSLTVEQGSVVGLLGPNGSGKTTTFLMILGFIKPDQGSLWIGPQNIISSPPHIRSRMGLGYLPQEPSIFRKLTVEQNIMAVLEFNPKYRSHLARHHKLDELLHAMDISHLRYQTGSLLSGGERRRAEIAKVLAMDPDFILLDEPFAGVDPVSIQTIMHLIQTMALHAGVLITDHHVEATLEICNHSYILHQGHVICSGSKEIILNHPIVKQVYLGDPLI